MKKLTLQQIRDKKQKEEIPSKNNEYSITNCDSVKKMNKIIQDQFDKAEVFFELQRISRSN